MQTPLYLGIDLGGTESKAGLVDQNGNVRGWESIPTRPERGRQQVIAALAALCLGLMRGADVRAAGVGVPGMADAENGRVISAPNLHWEDVPLADELRDRLGLPVALDNDANAFALAEHTAGAAKGHSDVLAVTLGTGVGAGVIANGLLLRGAGHMAGEIGHMTLWPGGLMCNCGQRGCFEMYASARALARMGKEAAVRYPDGRLAAVARQNGREPTARDVAECARGGDAQALAIWDAYTSALALGLSNAARVLDPGVVVLGGGVAQSREFLLAPLREKLAVLSIGGRETGIAAAALGAKAGVVGAAMLARGTFKV